MFGLSYAPFMAAEIPPEVDCLHLPRDAVQLEGVVRPASLARVSGDFRIAGDTHARLTIERNDNRNNLISGHLTGSFTAPLEARCQRCLDWMALKLEREFSLDVLTRLPQQEPEDDYVYAENGRLAVITLIEDEILLACPMIPAHDAAACAAGAEDPVRASSERQKPFAGLDELVRAARGKPSDA